MDKNFVLVHLGEHFFDYINDCIQQIRKFNTDKIYLITKKIHFNQIVDKKVVLVDYELLPKTKNHLLFDSTNKLDESFRNGFWRFTTERFLYIEDLMTDLNLKNVLHLENDTLIYFNYSDYIENFYSNYEVATIFDNDNRSVPCLVYLKNKEIISEINNFFCNFTTKNDMLLFVEYKNFFKKSISLPILPKSFNLDLKSINGDSSNRITDYTNNFDSFNSIFDGAALGQFLGGVDPRNIGGNTIGHINELCLFNPNVLNISFDYDENGLKVPFFLWEEKKYKINNLHIHSKNLKKFIS